MNRLGRLVAGLLKRAGTTRPNTGHCLTCSITDGRGHTWWCERATWADLDDGQPITAWWEQNDEIEPELRAMQVVLMDGDWLVANALDEEAQP